MRSTTRPTSRTRARITTPATWRWCARISRKFRSCWPLQRRRSRPRSMRARAAISAWCCHRGSAASTCRISRRSICAAPRRCAAEQSLVAVGPGVERLQEEAAQLFPDARTMVLSSDLITSIETMRGELNEIEDRERAGYPPFGRLASLIISAGDRPTAESFARRLSAIAPIDERIKVLGPAEAPLAVIKGRYRFRLLVKSLRNVDLSEYLREWLAAGPKTKGNLKLEVDVDPQSFL